MVVQMVGSATMGEVDEGVEVAVVLEVVDLADLTEGVVEAPEAELEWEWAIVEDSISLVDHGTMDPVAPTCRSRITLITTPSLYKAWETTILWTLSQISSNRSALLRSIRRLACP